jgi:hypothetical protein
MASRPQKGRAERKTLVELSSRGTLTLPKAVRTGTSLYEVRARENGTIELIPQTAVDGDQAWFWSERWQRMEREAQADIDTGKVRRYKNAAALIKDLERS